MKLRTLPLAILTVVMGWLAIVLAGFVLLRLFNH
jgi:hypothetical protein